MNNKPQDTEEILSAIRDMMNDGEIKNEQPLPNDVLKLTEKIESKSELSDHENILELTQLAPDNGSILNLDNIIHESSSSSNEEDGLRKIIREAIKNHSSDKIDLIIKQEMKKVIEEKLTKAQVVLDPKDKI